MKVICILSILCVSVYMDTSGYIALSLIFCIMLGLAVAGITTPSMPDTYDEELEREWEKNNATHE